MPATFIGPVSPPSPWSLDGVPGTILDIIVGHVAQQARQDHACVSTDCLCKRANDRSVINFTPNIKNLSMVDNTFRHNVMSRLIFHTIEVGSRKNIIKLRKKVRECSLRSVRIIWFIPVYVGEETNLDGWTLQRNRLFLDCPNLERVIDFSGELAYGKHNYPDTVTRIELQLNGMLSRLGHISAREARNEPLTLDASGLQVLEIDIDGGSRGEHEGSLESARFGPRLAELLRGCEELERLSLQMPGLSSSCLPGNEQTHLQSGFPDPIAGALSRLGTLELDIPFCSVEKGSASNPYWWGYLGWIGATPVQYTRLNIQMRCWPGWGPPGFTARELLDEMGLDKLSTRKSDGKAYAPSGNNISDELCDFFRPLLEMRPQLQHIEVKWFVKTRPLLYRYVLATRDPAATAAKPEVVITERILYDVIDELVQEVCAGRNGSFMSPPIPITPDFNPITMLGALPPQFASTVTTVVSEMENSFVSAVAPVPQTAEEEGHDVD